MCGVGTPHLLGQRPGLTRPSGMQGGWLWHVKRWIDRGWMRMYGEGIPQMPAPEPDLTLARHLGPAAEAAVVASAMRCCGCGGKVSPLSGSQADTGVDMHGKQP